MKVTTSNNAELVIQAKDEKDYAKACRVADAMVKDSDGFVVTAAGDPNEFWIHLTASWDYNQREDIRDYYRDAKKATK